MTLVNPLMLLCDVSEPDSPLRRIILSYLVNVPTECSLTCWSPRASRCSAPSMWFNMATTSVCVCVSVSAVGSLSQSLAKPIDPPPARTTEGPANSGISNFKEARLCVVSTHTESHTSVSTKMQPSCRTSVWAEVVFYSG